MEENILDIIQKIQEVRNPKYFLWNIIKNVKFFTSKIYNGWLVGKKDDEVYFNYDIKNHILYYSYYKIYQILSSKYHLNEVKANELVSGMVSEHFKLKVNTTKNILWHFSPQVSEHFNLRVNTTETASQYYFI